MPDGITGGSAPISAPTPAATPAPTTPSNPLLDATTVASGTPAVATTPASPAANVNPNAKSGAEGLGAFILGLESQSATGQAANTQTTAGQQQEGSLPQQPTQQPTTQPVATAEPQTPLIAGKFKTQEDLVKAYQNAEQHNTRLAQRQGLPEGIDAQRSILEQLNALQQENQQLKVQKPQQAQSQQATQAETQTQQTADNLGMSEEEIAYMIQSEPHKLFELMQEQTVKAVEAKLSQVQQQQQAEKAAEQAKIDSLANQLFSLRTAHPDFDGLMNETEKTYMANPGLANLPNGVEIAYQLTKAAKLEQEIGSIQRQRPIEELAQDPAIQQQLLNNPALRQAFIGQMATQIKNNQPPVIVSGQSAGSAPAAPAPKITSIKDASKAYLAHLNQMDGRIS